MNIRNVTWMNANASNVSIPTAYAAIAAAIAARSHPRSDSSRFASRAEPPDGPDEEPEPAEESDDARSDQRPEPLVVEDVRLDAAGVEVDDLGAEALAEHRLPLPELESRGRGPRGVRCRAVSALACCSATRPPAGRNDCLIAPSVPGSAKWIATGTTSSAGHSRRVSRGRSQRNTTPTTTNMTIPVREIVDAHAAARAPAQNSQRRWR